MQLYGKIPHKTINYTYKAHSYVRWLAIIGHVENGTFECYLLFLRIQMLRTSYTTEQVHSIGSVIIALQKEMSRLAVSPVKFQIFHHKNTLNSRAL